MTDLRISDTLSLPLDAVTETFGILAKRGSGKTYLAGVLVEELLGAHLPVVVIDPLGVWWGLRSSADGKSPGDPIVIFGGDHADVPLLESAGELVADVIVTDRISAVLDLSDFTKSAARRFMTDFAERLYHRNREPLHLVVDEADAFAPQRAQHGAERLLGAMEDIVRRGRSRGLGATLITQRPAVLNKDVLTQIEALFVLRMTGPRDVAAIDEWVRLHADEDEARQVKASLPSLPIGTAWLWSPGWLGTLQRVKVRRKRTYDSSSTPTAGQRRPVPRAMAPVDLAALGQRIEATIEQAKADDPKLMRVRIRELEQLLHQRPEPVVQVLERPVLDAEGFARVDALIELLTSCAAELSSALRSIQPAVDAAARPVAAKPSPARRAVPTPAPSSTVELRSGARRMVEALGRMAPMRLTKGQWGTVAKLKTSGGTWSTYLSDIRRAGFLDETGAGYTLTALGFDFLGGAPVPMTAEELQGHYRTILRSGAVKMLDALIEGYPSLLSREELGVAAEMVTSGGTFSTYLSDLIRNGLAVKVGAEFAATDILMLGASA